ncbi:MAG: hypothetical protein GX969_08900 [Firmicutes bacterium]|nr:hypothetical protein [Bacillota bacterium]
MINARKESLYIAMDGYDLAFTKRELSTVVSLWNTGESITNIAKKLGRGKRDGIYSPKGQVECEVTVLIMDLAMKEKIKPRPGGVFGDEANNPRRATRAE